jgi:hypothetical protein
MSITPIRSKGTLLQMKIATVYTTVAGIETLKAGEIKSQTYNAPTLDQTASGIPKKPTGFTDFGSVSGSGFYDPNLAGHRLLEDLTTTPATQDWQILWSDTNASNWTFTGGGFGFTVTAAQADGLKFDFSIDIDGNVTFGS